jgi:UDP-GlcNAc:undecaprenyl-phosphate GlcNAc-1-phosphate transferase
MIVIFFKFDDFCFGCGDCRLSPYNYHPAIIYLGDTGALFIGFMIGVFSLQGLKNSTAVAVVTPIIILGVPITDTVVAIIRRKLSGQKIYEADRMHLHHRLLSLGLTHRGTVLVIYAISFIFSLTSLLLNISSQAGSLVGGFTCLGRGNFV